MSRGRTPRTSPQSDYRSSVRRAAAATLGRPTHVEDLEERRLLTTLTGGQFFTYYDAANQRIRITLSGSITAEFLAARISKTSRGAYTANGAVIRDLIPPPPPQNAPPGYQGADLFSIYVAEAGPDASIYITQVDEQGRPTPYAGSAGSIRTNLNDADPPVDDPLFPVGGPGVVYIGARTTDIIQGTTTEENRPITSVRNSAIFGVRPSTRVIYAGLQTAAGVNLQDVFIGGTITGIVNVEGSLGTFYAGGVLTGDADGLGTGTRTTVTNNFNVAGDLQRMYVGAGTAGSVGTNNGNQFRTGTNIRIGGRLGYLHVAGNWRAQLQDRAVTDAPAITTPMPEGEQYYATPAAENSAFEGGQLAQSVTGTNAAAGEDAQFSYSDTNGGMAWSGTLQNTTSPPFNDSVDSYSLPLMAGQTTTLELVSEGTAYLRVLDPTGRAVATDLPGPTSSGFNLQFQYTAKIPGVYTLQVVNDNVIGVINGVLPYSLTANAAGFVPVGGVSIGGSTRFNEPGNGVALRNGDLGAWLGTGAIGGTLAGPLTGAIGSPIDLSRGSLRAMYGAGVITGVDLVIPRGSLGHLRSGGNMIVNPSAFSLTAEPNEAFAIGGQIQRVESGANLAGGIVANGRIGTVIAATINAVNNQGSTLIAANADQRGSDGTIDMIYCSGDFGNGSLGGPGLFNGLDGNIKYVYVGGAVYRDQFFGGTLNSQFNLAPGRSINFVDDSGARAVIRPTDTVVTDAAPTGSVIGTTTDPLTGATTVISLSPTTGTLVRTVTTPGSLDYIGYGVRGVGGQVMINLHSTSSIQVVGQTPGAIDLGNVVTNATGTAPVVGTLGLDTDSDDDGIPDVLVDINRGVNTTVGYPPATTTPTDPNTPTAGENFTTIAPVANEINFYGPAEINVFHIVGSATGTDATAVASTNITAINNFTSGEIVSVNAANLGMINARRVGLSDPDSETQLLVPGNMGTAGGDAGGALPFDQFSRGIVVGGPIISVLARDGIGNVSSTSTINTINPNTDGKNARGVNDGINGAIRATVLNVVQIGEGIGYAGSGDLLNTGLYATDTINNVIGNNADIRGPVVANQFINSIALTNGSIVNTTVGTLGAFNQALYTALGVSLIDPPSNLGFALNQILIRGNGGIIGSDLEFGNFANITVEGFGIIGSSIGAIAASNVNGQINAAGFGIRSSFLDLGSSIRQINVSGNGRVLSTADYNQRVNQSGGARRLRFDPYSGRLLNGSNDLNRFFGTTRTSPRLSGSTNAGVIADTEVIGNGTLGSLNAYAYTTADTDTPITSAAFPNRLAFATNIGDVNIRHTVSGLQVRTGKLDNLNIGTNLQRADIRVAGEIGNINVGGTIRGSTYIAAQNANGQIGSIVARGGLYGTVTSRGQIGTIGADTIGAEINSSSGITRIGVTNNVLTGSVIRARRTIDRIVIGGDFENDALIQAADVKVFRVGGANLGDLDEG